MKSFFADFVLGVAVLQLIMTSVVAADKDQLLFELHSHTIEARQSSCGYYSVGRKIDALKCQESYVRAVNEEIKRSKCRNKNYIYDEEEDEEGIYDLQSLCDGAVDDREGIDECSLECSDRQTQYLTCTLLADQLAEIQSICVDGYTELQKCWYSNGDFCNLKINETKRVLFECYLATPVDSREVVCNGGCRQAVDKYKNEVGCCVNYWAGTYFKHGPNIEDYFEACGVDLPNKCTRIHPPKEFLECAQNSADAGWVGSAHFFIINGLSLGVFLML